MRLTYKAFKLRLCFGVAVALAILVATPVLAQEQTADTTFLNRNIRQQMFLISYFEENNLEHPPNSVAEVDSFYAGAAEAWDAEVDGEDPLIGQFNPYVSIWLVRSIYARTESEIPKHVECHTYAEHVVPAFLADFERYSEVASAHSALVRWGYDWAAGPLAFRCGLDAERWGRLAAAFERAPSLFQAYLDAGAYPDERIGDQIRGAQQFFERHAPLYAIRSVLYRGDLDRAFAGLAAAATQGHGADYIRPLGESLWRAYAESGQTDHALAALDLLARILTAGDLSRDTLRAWYAEVAPERGPERFEIMVAPALPTFVASEERADLRGTYTDLLTGEPLDLAELRGRLVFLDFWATWCAPCIAEIPKLRALVAEHGDRVAFVSINADAVTVDGGPDGVRGFMAEHGVDYPVLFDEPNRSLAAQFGVEAYGYPAKFLVSPEGVFLVHPSDGRRTVSLAEVDAYLEGLR